MTPVRHVCAIEDSVPAYRQGLARELHVCGHETAEPDDCLTWLHSAEWTDPATTRRPAVLLAVRGPAEITRLASLLAQASRPNVLALLVEPTTQAYRQVIEAGADGVIDYSAPPAEIVATLEASWTGAVRLPRATARELLRRSARRDDDRGVDAADVPRLIALADGWSIERLAARENFSTREMFRRLQELYRGMGVANRHQAVAEAARRGLLDEWQPASGLSSQWRAAAAESPGRPATPTPVPQPRSATDPRLRPLVRN